jgi:hypothetical protein
MILSKANAVGAETGAGNDVIITAIQIGLNQEMFVKTLCKHGFAQPRCSCQLGYAGSQ